MTLIRCFRTAPDYDWEPGMPLPPELRAEVEALRAGGERAAAIRLVRAKLRIGLKDAMDMVDALA